ncbi:hypothetical protein DLD99_13425 [Pseudomonas kribbensis]|uniref:Uncharacterized protein n=1 Tax=Pseudomonas kribbensis TaxID=1628086 RepID=A0A345RQ62_9PSED|nr:hypothetical protein [Pseudomonas kribbensis]AXI61428.1 hypothetical protein DLD99_13425 [Pseudomonas kribbensis]
MENSLESNPKIYLGDRGFLKRYGSLHTLDETRHWFRKVAQDSCLGLASGDWRTAMEINRTLDRNSGRHLYHSRFLTNAHEKLSGRLLGVSELQRNARLYGCSREFRFSPDWRQINEDIEIIKRFRPRRVSIGGDWLDMLLEQGQNALIEEILQCLQSSVDDVEIEWLMLTFKPSRQALSLLDRFRFDGVLAPVNLLQPDCNENRVCLDEIRRHSALYALHCLAGGVIPVMPAIDYALNHMGASACVVGAGKSKHIMELMRCEALYRRACP